MVTENQKPEWNALTKINMPTTGENFQSALLELDKDMDARRNTRSGYLEIKPSDGWIRYRSYFKRLIQPDGWIPVDDEALVSLADDLAQIIKKHAKPKKENLRDMIRALGTVEGQYADPFINWLNSLPAWDETDRYLECAVVAWKAEAAHHSRQYLEAGTRIVLNGAVERAYDPGCEHDIVLTLIGAESAGKTSGLRETMPNGWQKIWYRKSLSMNRTPKETIEETRGYVMVECSELEGRDKKKQERVKNFIDDPFDVARLAYDKETSQRPRTFVLVASSNDDSTGVLDQEGKQRRFWPIQTRRGSITDLQLARAWLNDNRDQLWAQALHEYLTYDGPSNSWRPTASLSNEHREHVDTNRETTPGSEIADAMHNHFLTNAWQGPEPLNQLIYRMATMYPDAESADSISEMMGRNRAIHMEIAARLKQLGWTSSRARSGEYRNRHVWDIGR